MQKESLIGNVNTIILFHSHTHTHKKHPGMPPLESLVYFHLLSCTTLAQMSRKAALSKAPPYKNHAKIGISYHQLHLTQESYGLPSHS